MAKRKAAKKSNDSGNGKRKPVPLTKPLFHITDVANVEAILREGIKGGTTPRNRGKTMPKPSVFCIVTDNVNLTNDVATNQIWPGQDIDGYAVIRIEPEAITGPMWTDPIAEQYAAYHVVVEQDVIGPAYLTSEVRQYVLPGAKLFKLMHEVFLRRALTTDEWALARKYFDPGLVAAQEQAEKQGAVAG